MKRLRFLITMLAAVFALSVSADDGQKVTKRMSDLKDVPDDVLVKAPIAPVAEHAFTGMMGFYVPAQAASGLTLESIEYFNIDSELVEELTVAKPLINVYIYGPAFEVEGTAFEHSFMDTYAAVSLDDGVTWKQTNLSDTAKESSFTLSEDHLSSRNDPLPPDHTILYGSKNNGAYHAPGADYPYTNHCTECHGYALQGTAQAPACYSCHDSNKWEEEAPDNIGPIVKTAIWKSDKLSGEGENAPTQGVVTIENGETGHELMTTDATLLGDFYFNTGPENVESSQLPPCTVAASSEGLQGPSARVLDKNDRPVEDCVGYADDVDIYPGGTYNVVHSVIGNKVLVAWPSRFCQQGQPAYSFAWDGDDEGLSEEQLAKRAAVAELTGVDITTDLYLTDLFGVAGNQGSIDFADEGYPQAGVVPFGCVWTARGVLVPGDDPRTEDATEESHMVWTKAERLTSGRRDPNRIEVAGVAGAGFVLTWQEDPDGLRPGQGEGPGEGWSGAVAHDKTDVWYSFIPWEYFDLVEDPEAPAGEPVNIVDHDLTVSGTPQVYVPMAVPMRLTNNDKCQADEYGPGATPSDNKVFSYCNYDVAAAYGLQDFCADTVSIPLGPQGAPGDICVNEDGLPNVANTASTRPRTSLQGYDSTPDDGIDAVDSAWVIIASEESKGLGRFAFLPDGTPCTVVKHDEEGFDPDCTADIGKNQWYFSFDMGDPATSATITDPNGLVENLVQQGNMLNQPEVDWRTGEFYPVINTVDMWDFGAYNFDIYNTEIARRSSLLVQSIKKAEGGTSGLLAITSYKQGPMRQGGPADVMFRRLVLPEEVTAQQCTTVPVCVDNEPNPDFKPNDGLCKKDPLPDACYEFIDAEGNLTNDSQTCGEEERCSSGTDGNPYAFTNMECENWLIESDAANPYYPGGVCGDPATNLSSVIPDECIDTGTTGEIACPTVDFTSSTFGIGDTNPILQGYIQGEGNTMKVLTWHQCPSDGDALDTSELEGAYFDCDTDDRTDAYVNLKDQSWYNPLDVAKGHRGFLDGDFVMFLYAWSPNWRLNAKGNDRYDLYVRRSFDGGQTWRTTPSSFTASDGNSYSGDGTVTCETYRSTVTQTAEAPEPHVCFDYPADGNEQARNVTQHQRMRITTLDPRFALSGGPTGVSISTTCIADLGLPELPEGVTADGWVCNDDSVIVSNTGDTDVRDPSRYFLVYETGDNSTVEQGEAEPQDLFYSRAVSFGDDYEVWAETDSSTADATLCYPSDPHEDEGIIGTVIDESGFCNEFDRLNSAGDTHSSEASILGNPDGSKMYGVWAQWIFEDDEDYDSDIIESDAIARRVWWIDDYISTDYSWTLPGTNQPE